MQFYIYIHTHIHKHTHTHTELKTVAAEVKRRQIEDTMSSLWTALAVEQDSQGTLLAEAAATGGGGGQGRGDGRGGGVEQREQ